MRVAERATPVAAVIAALSTLACCVPFGFLGAMGLAGLSGWAQSFRNWFIGGAAILLVVGLCSYIGAVISAKSAAGEHRSVLARCCYRSPDCPIPPSNRQPSSGVSQVKMKYAAWFALVVLGLSVG